MNHGSQGSWVTTDDPSFPSLLRYINHEKEKCNFSIHIHNHFGTLTHHGRPSSTSGTEVVTDMYRSSIVPKYRSNPPKMVMYTELALYPDVNDSMAG